MKIASALFNGILLLIVALGVRDVFFAYEGNRCSMTYMFEYPEYQVSSINVVNQWACV